MSSVRVRALLVPVVLALLTGLWTPAAGARTELEGVPAFGQVYVVSAGSAKDLNHYGAKHNPGVFYDNVEGLGGVWSADPSGQSAECKANDIPAGGTGPNDMSAFNRAVSAGDVGRFTYIVPNEC